MLLRFLMWSRRYFKEKWESTGNSIWNPQLHQLLFSVKMCQFSWINYPFLMTKEQMNSRKMLMTRNISGEDVEKYILTLLLILIVLLFPSPFLKALNGQWRQQKPLFPFSTERKILPFQIKPAGRSAAGRFLFSSLLIYKLEGLLAEKMPENQQHYQPDQTLSHPHHQKPTAIRALVHLINLRKSVLVSAYLLDWIGHSHDYQSVWKK